MKCKNCGYESEEKFIFCPSCKTKSDDITLDLDDILNQGEEKVIKHKFKNTLFVLSIICLIGSIAAMALAINIVSSIYGLYLATLILNLSVIGIILTCVNKNNLYVKTNKKLIIALNIIGVVLASVACLIGFLLSLKLSEGFIPSEYLYGFIKIFSIWKR